MIFVNKLMIFVNKINDIFCLYLQVFSNDQLLGFGSKRVLCEKSAVVQTIVFVPEVQDTIDRV